MVYQGTQQISAHSENVFLPLTKQGLRGATGRASVVGLRTDNGENRRNTNGCKFYENDADAMRMMT